MQLLDPKEEPIGSIRAYSLTPIFMGRMGGLVDIVGISG